MNNSVTQISANNAVDLHLMLLTWVHSDDFEWQTPYQAVSLGHLDLYNKEHIEEPLLMEPNVLDELLEHLLLPLQHLKERQIQ